MRNIRRTKWHRAEVHINSHNSMKDEHRALAFAAANRPRFIEELRAFIRFPSVRGKSKHGGDIRKCAHWLANQLRHAGLDRVKIVPTKGSPIVYAEWLRAPGKPTVLIYGHYDVVPPEPLSEWKSPPFQP